MTTQSREEYLAVMTDRYLPASKASYVKHAGTPASTPTRCFLRVPVRDQYFLQSRLSDAAVAAVTMFHTFLTFCSSHGRTAILHVADGSG
jgi:hypothetical protein